MGQLWKEITRLQTNTCSWLHCVKISYFPHQKGFRVWERVQHCIHWFYLPTANLSSKSAQFPSLLRVWWPGAWSSCRCVEHNSYISTLTTTVKTVRDLSANWNTAPSTDPVLCQHTVNNKMWFHSHKLQIEALLCYCLANTYRKNCITPKIDVSVCQNKIMQWYFHIYIDIQQIPSLVSSQNPF